MTLRPPWYGWVAYGYGKDILGTAYASAAWQLSGAQSWSKPVRFRATGEIQNMAFSGEMFNGAPKIPHGGSEISGTRAVSGTTASAAPNTTISWNPNGYKAYNNTIYDHNVVTEFSWSVPGYPGYWYFYARSLCSHTTKKG